MGNLTDGKEKRLSHDTGSSHKGSLVERPSWYRIGLYELCRVSTEMAGTSASDLENGGTNFR
jgi:hypothetical protein